MAWGRHRLATGATPKAASLFGGFHHGTLSAMDPTTVATHEADGGAASIRSACRSTPCGDLIELLRSGGLGATATTLSKTLHEPASFGMS